MSRRQIWAAALGLAAYAGFILVFRETAESALSTALHFIGGVL